MCVCLLSLAECLVLHDVQGWQWLDEDWHIDMTGHEDACVDNEGWYYAVDFNWLKHPPAPGSGRFKRVHPCCTQLAPKVFILHGSRLPCALSVTAMTGSGKESSH